jgi:signal transduction histidine kinase/CheY-like chemotaxis protein
MSAFARTARPAFAYAASEKVARRARQVRTEQVRSVYLHSPYTTIGSLLAGALLVAVMWGEIAGVVLVSWSAVLCLHQALRIHHYRSYMKAPAEDQADDKWARRYTFAATTAGLIWGSAGFLMFVPESVPHQAFLSLVLYGIALVSMTSLSAYAPAFYTLIPLTLIPFVIRTILEPGAIHVYIAAPGVIVLGMALALGRNVNRLIAETLSKRFENMALIEELSQQTAIAEIARVQAETANRSKTQFFAAASHDLRQPLHAMGLFVAALNDKVRDPEAQSLLHNINASITALESFFDELLDISRIDAGVTRAKLVHFPVAMIFERIRTNFADDARHKRLKLSVLGTRRYVYSDPILLERILANLVSNAVRYTGSGGVYVGCRRRGGALRFEIRDSGVGIAEDDIERVFDEFYQIGNVERSRAKGMGLGLSIVRRLCALLGYDIKLVSAPGRGSLFSFEVPLGRAIPAAPGTETTLKAPGDLTGRFIVVVDDEPAIVEGMSLLLRGWGARVLAARSGDDLVEEIGKAGALPDLIIADYQLADAMTGVDLIGTLRRALDPEIPAIVITGTTVPERVEEARLDGCELLVKPVGAGRLRAVIEAVLRKKVTAA